MIPLQSGADQSIVLRAPGWGYFQANKNKVVIKPPKKWPNAALVAAGNKTGVLWPKLRKKKRTAAIYKFLMENHDFLKPLQCLFSSFIWFYKHLSPLNLQGIPACKHHHLHHSFELSFHTG